MVRHVLVTNDFPPKVGGIQNYLWELWRRLPPEDVVIYTTPHKQAAAFDAQQPFKVLRSREPWLLPQPLLIRRVNQIVQQYAARLVIIDPAIPAGLIGPHLNVGYGVVLHGAEVTVPAKIVGLRAGLNRVLKNSVGVISGGAYATQQTEQFLAPNHRCAIITPGVDTESFVPLGTQAKQLARTNLGLPSEGPLLVSVSRLVPRKGMDTLIKASIVIRKQHPNLCVAIAGAGRDRLRLSKLVSRLHAPVKLMGRLSTADLKMLYGCGDLFVMLCRCRWAGLEQEGFGIVFLESAASGVPQVAGRSGGAHEAVTAGETGLIVDDPKDVAGTAKLISDLLADKDRLAAMALASRERVEKDFSYDALAEKLAVTLEHMAQR